MSTTKMSTTTMSTTAMSATVMSTAAMSTTAMSTTTTSTTTMSTTTICRVLSLVIHICHNFTVTYIIGACKELIKIALLKRVEYMFHPVK